MMRSTLSTFTKHTIGRVLRRTSTKQRSITLVVRSLRHRCRGKAKNDSNSGKRDLLRPPLKRLQTTGQKTLLASTRNPQPDGAEAGHKIPLVVAVAIDSPSATPPFVPPPARIAIALPLRLQLEKPLPG